MMGDLPEPMTPADADLRNFAFMPLDVSRLRDSDLAAEASGDEFRAAVMLWCAAWHQIPAGSLPNDDKIIAHLAGYGRAPKEWKRIKAGALRGFVECSDGRLYHPHVAAKAVEAWESREKFAEKRHQDRERLKQWREAKRAAKQDGNNNGNASETRFRNAGETRANTDETRGIDRGQGTGDRGYKEKSIAAAKRGSRLPEDFIMPPEWLAWAKAERHWTGDDAKAEAVTFVDYWHAKSGKDATKVDWQATWRNWVRNSRRIAAVRKADDGPEMPLYA